MKQMRGELGFRHQSQAKNRQADSKDQLTTEKSKHVDENQVMLVGGKTELCL